MDIKTLNATLAEISALKRITSEQLEAFTSINGKSSVDILVHDPETGIVSRVEVKSCTQKTSVSYIVEIKRVRSNKTENTIYGFDPNRQEILCVYIVELDKILFFNASKITVTRQMTIPFSSIDKQEKVTIKSIMEGSTQGVNGT